MLRVNLVGGVIAILIILASWVVFAALNPSNETSIHADQAAKRSESVTRAVDPWAQAEATLQKQFGKQVRSLTRVGNTPTLELNASDNLTKGMIRSGMKLDAQRVFEAIHSSGYAADGALVQFYFPLTNTTTGADFDGIVAVYSLDSAQWSAIHWDNADAIDWDNFRTMLHPTMQ